MAEPSPSLRFWISLQQKWHTVLEKDKDSLRLRDLQLNKSDTSFQMRFRRKRVVLELVTDLKHPLRDKILKAQSLDHTLLRLNLKLESKEDLIFPKQDYTHLESDDSITRRCIYRLRNKIRMHQCLVQVLMILRVTQLNTIRDESSICREELKILLSL